MSSIRQGTTLIGSVLAAVLASACCILPIAFAAFGVSTAAFSRLLEPYRPILLAASFGLLGAAFYFTYRPRRESCDANGVCGPRKPGRLGRVFLWIAAVLVIGSATFPWYVAYLP